MKPSDGPDGAGSDGDGPDGDPTGAAPLDAEPEAEDGPPELEHDGQLAELLGAPDRDRCPGARPVISVADTDDATFLAEVNAHCVAAPELKRRGHFHGHWAELDDSLTFVPRDPMAALAKRWLAASPIVLHDALPDEVLEAASGADESTAAWGAELLLDDGLDRFLEARSGELASDFHVTQRPPAEVPAADERDIIRRHVTRDASPSGGGPAELWVKTQRLSLHPGDRSVRLRLSFGAEIHDDASRDPDRLRATSELATRLFPEAMELQKDPELSTLVGEWIGGRPLLTQAIAYWNAPEGGALFHHDAFNEPLHGRQRGVLYAQITGSTAWLALSLQDLTSRVVEFFDLLSDGTLAATRDELFATEAEFASLRSLTRDRAALTASLAEPGCGPFASTVNRGPEFTSLLADAGHAFVLSEGDVIVLPNHGLGSTCMHSVFCASEEPAFSLSLAIRDRMRPNAGRSGRARRRGGSRNRGGSRRGGGRPGRRPRSRRSR